MLKMIFRRQPAPCLAPYIESMAVLKQSSFPDDAVHMDIPNIHSYIIFKIFPLAGSTRASLSVVGSHSQIAEVPFAGGFEVTGARVRPGCLKYFLGVPVNEILDRIVPLENLWEWHGTDLLDRMREAPTMERRVQAMEEAFLRRLARITDSGAFVQGAERIIRDSNWRTPVGDMASAMGFTHRQLNRKFLEFSGFTPKEFFKTMRCRSIAQRIALGQFQDWSQFVHDYNYYDQSHFIHEFKESMKLTPGDYYDQVNGNMKVMEEVNPDIGDPINHIFATKEMVSKLLK